MLRRCTASLAFLTLALALAGGPAPASAASIVSEMVVNGVDTIVPDGTAGSTKYAYYSLVNNTPSTINQIVGVTVDPTGSVVTGTNGSPLSVVGGSTGFNTNFLGGFISDPGVTPQGLAFDFSNEPTFSPAYNNPLAAGGVANFKLSLDPSYSGLTAPTLTLQAPFTGLSLTSYTPAFADAAPGAVNTPEPVSMALWSILAGAGLLRARAFRRSRHAAPALVA